MDSWMPSRDNPTAASERVCGHLGLIVCMRGAGACVTIGAVFVHEWGDEWTSVRVCDQVNARAK
jgi:hypothetical protein